MSRKLRVDEERLLLNKDEEDNAEDNITIQSRRIKLPIVWKRTSRGIRIQDLKENYYDEVVDDKSGKQNHYISSDILHKNSDFLNDEESVQCYLNRILFQLKDSCSIIAVDENYVFEEFDELGNPKEKIQKPFFEGKIKIVGALLAKIMNKGELDRVFSSIKMIQGEAMKKCLDIKTALTRTTDIFEKFNCETFLRYYEMCVIPEYRHQGIGYQLMDAGLYVARSFKLPVVGGIFVNHRLQKLARQVGMQTINEINYCEWRDEEGELIFDDPGAGNYTCAYMAGIVPPRPPPPPVPPPTAEELAMISKVPRAKKQADLEAKLLKKK